ncbi:MAG: GNAT family N-acetyltransferase [Flavobacteriaceae bacterium]|nr:MAG: GNAT family N-acetyltransferase [Flavobacteriaceae bacterium]
MEYNIIQNEENTEEKDHFKAFVQALDGETIAGRMFYQKSGNVLTINHTEVEPLFGGKGIGKEMLYFLVEESRGKKLKINPVCPFAQKLFEKDLSLQDVLA